MTAPNTPQPGEQVNVQDLDTNPPAEPTLPWLANLIPNPKVRVALYSLWSLWALIYISVLVPALDEIPKWLTIFNGVGTILFTGVAAANVPKVVARAR